MSDDALNAVVTVGGGRGFVVQGRRDRYVITAAHCLPFLPPCHGFSYTEERTYNNLLARLGEQPSVWCEVLFADPVADIAVLGAPDNQVLSEQAEAYDALVEAATPLTIAGPPSESDAEGVANLAKFEQQSGATDLVRSAGRKCPASLLSLDNKWFACTVRHRPNGMLTICDAAQGIAGGMSGSPLVANDDSAIGIVCLGSGTPGDDPPVEGGPNPRLMGNLPGWLLRELHSGTVAG